ncbi:hypothetical protein HNY73_000312 [Argiope bruennichi]|uniref:Uncharacterized protein n=1 Tax=Argiope bruennichi TaxID=94029 RepID=A0A8T0FXT5_ARGBR|nr:hypothetical protein HNY73_000312 [Argiope bruennichi]
MRLAHSVHLLQPRDGWTSGFAGVPHILLYERRNSASVMAHDREIQDKSPTPTGCQQATFHLLFIPFFDQDTS